MTDDTPTSKRPAPAPTTTQAPPTDGPDTHEPNDARKVELHDAYEANFAKGKPPYAGVVIKTRGELEWILHERLWAATYYASEIEVTKARGEPVEPADLRDAVLAGANLGDIVLYNANLSGANLTGAYLEHAKLGDVNFSGAHLRYVHFAGSSLRYVNFHNAHLRGADLTAADLTYSNLTGSRLLGARLQGANLRGARMDVSTMLVRAQVDRETRLVDVSWGGVSLAQINWTAAPHLGDENRLPEARTFEEIPVSVHQNMDAIYLGLPQDPDHVEAMKLVVRGRKQRIYVLQTAARAYHGLAQEIRTQGLLIPASNYRLREQVLERKASFLEGHLLGWLFSWILFLVAGYGERPARSLVAYLLVLFGFAGAFFVLGSGALSTFGLGTHDAIHTPLAALVFSVTSFHGRGFFPGGLTLDDPITVLAAIEAIIGLFIEITFIATFTQRFFGSR